MLDSEFRGSRFRRNAPIGEEERRRAPKLALLTATSTKEATCSPTSTPFSPHLCARRRSPAAPQRTGQATEDHRRRARHARRRPGLPRLPQGAALPALRPSPAGAPVPLYPPAARLQQAPARLGTAAGAAAQLPRLPLAVVLRPAAAARLDTGSLRPIARDRQALGVRGLRRLRLLRRPLAPLLGLSPLPGLLAGRHAGRLRARAGQRPEREVAEDLLARVD